MQYVFGPVLSRRLGRSLGIDPVPLKTCNWNCVYCQLGRTRPMVAERKVWAPTQEIISEMRAAAEAHQGQVDWVTFAGSGEPTLHSEIGELLRGAKAMRCAPVAMITNGSLLHLPEVRRDLVDADAILPSLDAGSEAIYRKMVRPHPEATFDRLRDGLVALRQEYKGRMWIETMLVGGVNDDDDALGVLAEVMRTVGPDEIHINVSVRPPAEPWVSVPSEERLARAASILGAVAPVVVPSGRGGFRFEDGPGRDPVQQIVEVIGRHPLPERTIREGLSELGNERVEAIMSELSHRSDAQRLERAGEFFWTASASFYPASPGHAGSLAPGGQS